MSEGVGGSIKSWMHNRSCARHFVSPSFFCDSSILSLPPYLAPPLPPQESSSANLVIISDLDGTLLPAPRKDEATGKVLHPTMREGPTFAPLTALMELGATVVGVTGSRITMHKPRFWDCLPLQARKEGRALLFCETGMVLYRPDEHGEPIEDEVSRGEEEDDQKFQFRRQLFIVLPSSCSFFL